MPDIHLLTFQTHHTPTREGLLSPFCRWEEGVMGTFRKTTQLVDTRSRAEPRAREHAGHLLHLSTLAVGAKKKKKHSKEEQHEGPPWFYKGMYCVKMREQPFWQYPCKNPRSERNNRTSTKWQWGFRGEQRVWEWEKNKKVRKYIL